MRQLTLLLLVPRIRPRSTSSLRLCGDETHPFPVLQQAHEYGAKHGVFIPLRDLKALASADPTQDREEDTASTKSRSGQQGSRVPEELHSGLKD